MAALAETAPATAGPSTASASQRRRARPQKDEVQEVVDELALETRRTTLLNKVEDQLKEKGCVSRILFAFSVVDDKKTHNAVEQEFTTWLQKLEEPDTLTGVLIFMAQTALHFLEGPTELIFKVLDFFHAISSEAASQPLSPLISDDGVKIVTRNESAPSRPALVSSLKIVHFTELHGIRTSVSWCTFVHPGKLVGATQIQLEEGNCPEIVFAMYVKVLKLCLRAQELAEKEGSDVRIQSCYRKASDLLPTVDEVLNLLGKGSSEFLFTYAEFQKIFVAPFRLVLHSELLWPIPPALSY